MAESSTARRSELIKDVLARELLADERRLNDLEMRVAQLAARHSLGSDAVSSAGAAPHNGRMKSHATPTPDQIQRVEQLSTDVSKLVDILGRRMASHEYEWSITQQRIDQRLKEAEQSTSSLSSSSSSSSGLPFPFNHIEHLLTWLLTRIDRMGKTGRLIAFGLAFAVVATYSKRALRLRG